MSRRSPRKRESLDSLTTREISLTRSCRTQRFNKMRNFAGLLKPVVCTIKQVGRQVLFLLNNIYKTDKRINIKPEIALFIL